MANKALIFIPDISGFTKFVTETSIKHSEHIIAELMEIIINSNVLDFTVSEIEGDAVLFYKNGPPPEIDKLLQQSIDTFVRFHNHLKIIERDNVCQCEACSTATNLSLKFISHYGSLSEVDIQGFKKIMGSDVILAHRLLKNNLSSNEYLLITDNYFQSLQKKEDELNEFKKFSKNIETIENFGAITTYFVDLKAYKEEIPTIRRYGHNIELLESPDFELLIEAPIQLVHDVLTDARLKEKWVPGIREVKNAPKINRLNSTHICVFDKMEINFTTTSSVSKNDELFFSERGRLTPEIYFDLTYHLQKINSQTRLLVKIKPSIAQDKHLAYFKRFLIKFKGNLLITKIHKSIEKSSGILKQYCENLYDKKLKTVI